MIAEAALIPLVLMALIPLGLLVALVVGAVHAIRSNRPGTILWTLAAGLFLLLIAGGVFLTGLVVMPRQVAWKVQSGDRTSSGSYRGVANTGTMYANNGSESANWDSNLGTTSIRLSSIKVFVLLGVLWFFFSVARSSRYAANGGSRPRWGRAIVVILLIMFVLAPSISYVRQGSYDHARQQADVAQKQAQDMQRQVEKAQRELANSQRSKIASSKHKGAKPAVVAETPTPADSPQSIEQWWEVLMRPRIDLSGETSTPPSINSDAAKLADMARELQERAATQLPAEGDGSRESLIKSLARLEQLARQISTVASDVSEIATVVARATVVAPNSLQDRVAAGPAIPPAPNVKMNLPPTPVAAAPVASISNSSSSSTSAKATKTANAATVSQASATEDVATETHTGKRPDWVNNPPKRVGNVRREVVVVGEYSTDEECYQAADIRLKAITTDYIKQNIASVSKVAGSVPSLDQLGIGLDYIRHEIAADEYMETVERSVGPMKNLYTLVNFSKDVDADLHRAWDAYQRQSRFTMVGVGAASILGLLGLTLGLLKADTATKGYYTKRLFLGVPAVIIGLVTLLGLRLVHM